MKENLKKEWTNIFSLKSFLNYPEQIKERKIKI